MGSCSLSAMQYGRSTNPFLTCYGKQMLEKRGKRGYTPAVEAADQNFQKIYVDSRRCSFNFYSTKIQVIFCNHFLLHSPKLLGSWDSYLSSQWRSYSSHRFRLQPHRSHCEHLCAGKARNKSCHNLSSKSFQLLRHSIINR
jgi:hypothetical protein